jgi:preprotein translocase subunit SecG
MYTLFTVLIVIACVLLILVVLVQNSKGGGLTSGLSSSNQIMGVRKTADFLEKLTWGLAVGLVALSLLANLSIPRGDSKELKSVAAEKANEMGGSVPLPVPAPPPAPAK